VVEKLPNNRTARTGMAAHTFNELEGQNPSQACTSEEALYSRLALTTGTSAWTVPVAETK